MKEIEDWLNSRIGLNYRSGLSRMEQAVELLGYPYQSYPIIHVTGTNGKGSTIAFLTNLFSYHERKVGTFTSPHMVSIHDRICINSEPISDQDFARLGQVVREMESNLLEPLSYFEILTLIAFLYFKEQEVEVALIEVGIGGLLDTTNVVDGELALITSIGLDHQETLGSTIEEIAIQKAGIFKSNQLALIGPLPEEAQKVCFSKAEELGISLKTYGKDFRLENQLFTDSSLSFGNLKLGLEGAYQEENAALALEAFLIFSKEHDWDVDINFIGDALEETKWAGRLEKLSPQIYIDGAHNLPAVERLVSFIKTKEASSITILFGALKRKDYSSMLDYLTQTLPDVHLVPTTFDYGQALEREDIGTYPYIENYKAYLSDFEEEEPDGLVFVTGSLYFIAEVRTWYLEKK